MPPGVWMLTEALPAYVVGQLRVDLRAGDKQQRHRRTVDAQAGLAQRGRQRNLRRSHVDRAHGSAVNGDQSARRQGRRVVGGVHHARNHRRGRARAITRSQHRKPGRGQSHHRVIGGHRGHGSGERHGGGCGSWSTRSTTKRNSCRWWCCRGRRGRGRQQGRFHHRGRARSAGQAGGELLDHRPGWCWRPTWRIPALAGEQESRRIPPDSASVPIGTSEELNT